MSGLLDVLQEPLSGLLRGNGLRCVLDTTNHPTLGRSLAAGHRAARPFMYAAWATISFAAQRSPREWVRTHPQEQRAKPPSRAPASEAGEYPVSTSEWVAVEVAAIVTTPFGKLPPGSVSDLLTRQTLQDLDRGVNTVEEKSSNSRPMV